MYMLRNQNQSRCQRKMKDKIESVTELKIKIKEHLKNGFFKY